MPFLFRATPQHGNRHDGLIARKPTTKAAGHSRDQPAGTLDATNTPQRVHPILYQGNLCSEADRGSRRGGKKPLRAPRDVSRKGAARRATTERQDIGEGIRLGHPEPKLVKRSARVTAVGALVCALVLAGCGSDDDLDSASSSTTPPTTATAAPTTLRPRRRRWVRAQLRIDRRVRVVAVGPREAVDGTGGKSSVQAAVDSVRRV